MIIFFHILMESKLKRLSLSLAGATYLSRFTWYFCIFLISLLLLLDKEFRDFQ